MKDLLASIITDAVAIAPPYVGNHSHSKMLVQINSNNATNLLASLNVNEHIGGTLFRPDSELGRIFYEPTSSWRGLDSTSSSGCQ
jgi:hypothetical protein